MTQYRAVLAILVVLSPGTARLSASGSSSRATSSASSYRSCRMRLSRNEVSTSRSFAGSPSCRRNSSTSWWVRRAKSSHPASSKYSASSTSASASEPGSGHCSRGLPRSSSTTGHTYPSIFKGSG
ncbi:hypothetical protein ACSHWB_43165 [Lentzea sp. HUAS TT2]|uniref:hypothetical protein n=1 Tax=Lentzea sp. HUAS TT2 TaxID=3447454 RepID=UPI003F7042DF